MTNRGLLVVVADGEHARFVTADPFNVLRTVHSFDSAAAHLAAHDLVSDRPGRDFESARPGSHGVASRHDPHQLAKTRFAELVADDVGVAVGEGGVDRIVLVAPAHVLSAMEDALDARSAGLVVGRLAKDLVKTPDQELSGHLREWIGAPERAA